MSVTESWLQKSAHIATIAGGLAAVFLSISLVLPGEPEMFKPRKITLSRYDYGSNDYYLRIAAHHVYHNSTRLGRSIVLENEYVSFAVGGIRYRQHWQTFENFQPGGDSLGSDESVNARPIVIQPGALEAHETYYATLSKEWRFLSWDRFLTLLNSERDVVFKFHSVFRAKSRPEASTCRIVVDDYEYDLLVDRGWISIPCEEEGEGNKK